MKTTTSGNTVENWNLEDARDEILDLRKLVESINDSFECAETCETDADLAANLDEALTQALALMAQLKALKSA